MKTTTKERQIIAAIVANLDAGINHISIDQLGAALYTGRNRAPKPAHWRAAMASTLRNLSGKVEREGCRLRRTSKLGRGSKGEYEIMGDFQKFIKKY